MNTKHPRDDMFPSSQAQLVILDSIADGIFCIDPAGICTYCNASCLRLLGYREAVELLDHPMHERIHHSHRDGTEQLSSECQINRACRSGERLHVEDDVFWRKDGSRLDVEYRISPIREDGEIKGAVVSFGDTTVRREENVYRNRLAHLVECSFDAIISKDLEGRITSWNRGACEIYGYDVEEAVGQSISLILPGGKHEEESEIIAAVKAGVELKQFHVRRRRKNGEVCDVSLTVSPIYNADGQLVGSSSIERDITAQQSWHDDLLHAKSAAENAVSLANAANRSRAEFLANVSHELRTPMNAILGMLQLALDEPLDSTVQDYLKTARSSADSLLELVNEILDFSKIESGKFEISSQPFELRKTIDNAAKALAPRASEKGLEIFCEVDCNIPTQVVGDGRRLRQVINNLLSNAVKFTVRGEILVHVALVRKLPSEVRLRFSVSDTGIGIRKADQERIFSPFAQADMSSTRQQHGTGLGLSICRELIALMGGNLRLESKFNEGSRFFFELSLPVEDPAKPAELFPSGLVDNFKVLIVDDNPTNLRILEKILVSWSMQPVVAESGEQALRILDELATRGQSPALAIVDGLMPGVDGFELADRIARRPEKTRPPVVIMQTTSDLAMFSDRSASLSIADYITKPISQSALLDTVVQSLNLYSRIQQDESVAVEPADPPRQPLNILLVEDLPPNQKVVKAILKKRGHRVYTAGNGRVALERLQHGDLDFDVVLMDIQMPVMDGLQATTAIRNLPDRHASQIPIVAMTAHAMPGDREACLAAGMDAYIAKPIDARQLIRVSEAIVSRPDLTDGEEIAEPDSSTEPCSATVVGDLPTLLDLEFSLNRLGGDQELFKEFIEIFLEDSPALVETVHTSLKMGKPSALEKAAHALKGLMSNFGARPCIELAQRFEQAGKQNELKSIEGQLSELDRLYRQLCVELRGFVA